ncbi:unnamed protein product [Linum trigynum]|uniref:Uncharacterized protein n=1 Tax=Linum trigynum TaxID=586398 RepID=A0AAV2EC24_9ROSI
MAAYNNTSASDRQLRRRGGKPNVVSLRMSCRSSSSHLLSRDDLFTVVDIAGRGVLREAVGDQSRSWMMTGLVCITPDAGWFGISETRWIPLNWEERVFVVSIT